jgi:hypothetical protein
LVIGKWRPFERPAQAMGLGDGADKLSPSLLVNGHADGHVGGVIPYPPFGDGLTEGFFE